MSGGTETAKTGVWATAPDAAGVGGCVDVVHAMAADGEAWEHAKFAWKCSLVTLVTQADHLLHHAHLRVN